MQLVEQHVINKNDPRFVVIDRAAFASKNLYNAANYLVRQSFIFQGQYISYAQMDKLMKTSPDYCALPRDRAAFASKNLYNAANYLVRQSFIFQGQYISYAQMDKLMKTSPDYCALP